MIEILKKILKCNKNSKKVEIIEDNYPIILEQQNNLEVEELRAFNSMITFANGLKDKKALLLYTRALIMKYQAIDLVSVTKHTEEPGKPFTKPCYLNDLQEFLKINKEELKIIINSPKKKYHIKNLIILTRPWMHTRLQSIFNGSKYYKNNARDNWICNYTDKNYEDTNHKATLCKPWDIAIVNNGYHSTTIPLLTPDISYTYDIETEYDFTYYLNKYKVDGINFIDRNTNEIIKKCDLDLELKVIYEIGYLLINANDTHY